jgi:ATP-binding cassette subfamily B protein
VTSALYSRVFMTSLGLVAALATALIYGVGGTLAIARSLGVGTVVALTAYLQRLYGLLTALSNVQVDIMTTLVSFERVLEVLDLEPIIADAPDARPVPDGRVAVELDGVSFGYPSAAEVSLASLESVATLPRDTCPRARGRLLPGRTWSDGGARRAVGPRGTAPTGSRSTRPRLSRTGPGE